MSLKSLSLLLLLCTSALCLTIPVGHTHLYPIAGGEFGPSNAPPWVTVRPVNRLCPPQRRCDRSVPAGNYLPTTSPTASNRS